MKATYWTSTLLLAAALILSAASYLLHKGTIEGVRALGFPDFFRIQLAVLKVLAVIVIVAPFFPVQVKEWAYAGIGLFLITAIVAHTAHRDSAVLTLINLAFFALLVVSNIYLSKAKIL